MSNMASIFLKPLLFFLIIFSNASFLNIGEILNRDNTDDVGLISPKVGVDSPERVRYYFHFLDTILGSPCYPSRTYWIV